MNSSNRYRAETVPELFCGLGKTPLLLGLPPRKPAPGSGSNRAFDASFDTLHWSSEIPATKGVRIVVDRVDRDGPAHADVAGARGGNRQSSPRCGWVASRNATDQAFWPAGEIGAAWYF